MQGGAHLEPERAAWDTGKHELLFTGMVQEKWGGRGSKSREHSIDGFCYKGDRTWVDS